MIGASASGKTEIAKILINHFGYKKMVTYTTRKKRAGEKDGIDYHFLSEEDFLAKMKIDFFLETSKYHDHYYGTAFKDASIDKVLIVDIQGANNIYKMLKDDVAIFFIKTPESIRKHRMIARGDKLEDINNRLAIDRGYFIESHLLHIDYTVLNADHDLEEVALDIHQKYRNLMD
jgi:guanylate kinase